MSNPEVRFVQVFQSHPHPAHPPTHGQPDNPRAPAQPNTMPSDTRVVSRPSVSTPTQDRAGGSSRRRTRNAGGVPGPDGLGSVRTTAALAAAVLATMTGAAPSWGTDYVFLDVSQVGGLAGTSQFTSTVGNGVISVSRTFSPGGRGANDNDNPLIYPSQFTLLFPNTGQVEGHLAQTVYNHTSAIEFDLTGYNLKPSTVFGIWNISNEVGPAPGNTAAYWIEVIDGSSQSLPPSTWSHVGNQDNQTQVQGQQSLVLNPANGDLSPGGSINGGIGVHTDATFWDNLILPTGTQKIIVHADLPALNLIGDGVGYYFAEEVPEPTTWAAAGALGLLVIVNTRCRRRR